MNRLSDAKDVVVLQHRLLQYRVSFFERLKAACTREGLRLHLVHGQASPSEAVRQDTATLPWAHAVKNRFVSLRGKDALWQPYPKALRHAGLVVLMQENRILSNYPWLLRWPARTGQRVAYWGHGRNFQSDRPSGLREHWKGQMRNRVDWWFAYTDLSRRIVADGGFPGDRITVLNNAIDNDAFAHDLASTRDEQVAELRASIGAQLEAPVALYCGSLYPDKRIDLMVQAGELIQRKHPGFRLVVLGDGPSRGEIESAARQHRWLHWVGMQRGAAKAAWFKAADIYLSPGAVGLHVLDAFCAGLPMITTNTARHGPEIAYLESRRNGFVVDATGEAIARACCELIADPRLLASIRDEAARAATQYTIDRMVANFITGASACLAAPRADSTA